MTNEAVDAERWFHALRWLVSIKQAPSSLTVPVLNENSREIGFLRPIGLDVLRDQKLLERFVTWRNQNLSGYLDQRPTTIEGVINYVADVVYNPTRLTFLAFHEDRPIARMGAVRINPVEHESDGLVRGERGGGMRFLYHAQIAGMVLLFRSFNHQRIISRILSTNELALANSDSFGYDMEPSSVQPIYRKEHANGFILETSGNLEDRVNGVSLYTLHLTRRAFFETMAAWPAFQELDRRICSLLPKELGKDL